jgi:hypothetical protein
MTNNHSRDSVILVTFRLLTTHGICGKSQVLVLERERKDLETLFSHRD